MLLKVTQTPGCFATLVVVGLPGNLLVLFTVCLRKLLHSMWFLSIPPPPRQPTEATPESSVRSASFITRKYSKQESVLKLGWLPLKERRDWYLATATFRALHHDQWPNYLRLEYYQPRKPGLRSKNKYLIEQNCVTNTFKQTAPKLFNSLSLSLRSEENFKTFYNGTKKHFLERAEASIGRDGN